MRIDTDFFNQEATLVAPDLLGKYFVTNFPEGKVVGKIVETEAYCGTDDLACHASKGKTARTETLYGGPGRLYIYLNYGIFNLTNIVCDRTDFPAAVLIRAAEITEGENVVRKRLESNKFVKANDKLATGPGKFSIAFGLTGQHNRIDIAKSDRVYLILNQDERFDIMKTPRIGVDYAKHCKDYLWRYYIKNNKFVSKK